MKKADLYFSIFLLALSVFTFVEGLGYSMEAKGSIGSGFFPVWMSVFLFALSLANTIKIVRSFKKGGDKPFFASKTHRARAIIFFAALIVYILAIIYIGMYAATFIFTIFIYKIFDKFSWKATLPVAVGLVAFIYVVFVLVLKIQLPAGIL